MQTMNDPSGAPQPATMSGPPSDSLTPGQWARRHLFNSWPNGVVSGVLIVLGVFASYKGLRFVFVTGQWSPIQENMQLLMTALFPREHVDRIWLQLLLAALGAGIAIGLVGSKARTVAEETKEPFVRTPVGDYIRSYWSVVLLTVLLLVLAGTLKPLLLVAFAVGLGVVGWFAGSQLKGDAIALGWTIVALLGTTGFQALSGTGGWAWGFTALALLPVLSTVVPKLPSEVHMPLAAAGAAIGVGGLALKPGFWTVIIAGLALNGLWQASKGDTQDGARSGLLVVVGLAVYFLMGLIGHEGIDWSEWGGFHLNIIVAVGATALAFPLGILLAMGRRSTLPVVKTLSVAYIEFFRGAPLITFLLAAQYFLGFFLNSDTPLSLTTRVMAAITLFSAAYIAEIIRGGLQAVPKGQIEAGQAMGMSQAKIMRLIVLPQALRAVIPAMVGQFISLFKDTTLLSIVKLPELLGVRELVHGQDAFRTLGIAETLTFVAFAFWAVAFCMSRESQRLERRLGVGSR